ncbi:MAG: hypothetical protein IJ466_07400 [Clostridia bacterium]|nr:hypothetical protein [Clostridia bacterium]
MGDAIFLRRVKARIKDISAAVVTLASSALTYNGSAQTKAVSSVVVDGKTLVAGTDYIISGNTGTNAGSYELTITGTGKYKGTVSAAWSIAKLSLAKPTVSGSFTYNGSARSCTVSGMNSTYITQNGTTSATNAGTYTVKFTLKSTTNTQWSDGTTAAVSRTWSIAQATGSISVSPTSLGILGPVGTTGQAIITYTGDGSISVKSSSTGVATVSRSGNTVTVKLVATGSATITITLAAGTNYTGASCTIAVTTKIPVLSKYSGDVTALSVARSTLAATTVGNYAVFGGGWQGSGQNSAAVDAYNSSLTRSTLTSLISTRANVAATTVGNYAIFAGGGSGSSYDTRVDAYNKSLTRSTPDYLSSGAHSIAATTVGNYALFGGGYRNNSVNIVDAYNASLTRSTPTRLTVPRYLAAATTVGNYALFAGGYNSSIYGHVGYSTVDAYDASLTQSTPTELSAARHALAATTVNNHALFAGGRGEWIQNVVDVYDSSLTKSTTSVLSLAREQFAATTVGDYALFAGGFSSSDSYPNAVVDAYDASLTRSTPTGLSASRFALAATTVGSYAIFAGGATSGGYGNYSSAVDVYQYN